MDAQGNDLAALSINGYWYKAERDVAEQLIGIQKEEFAETCATNPDHFPSLDAFSRTAAGTPTWTEDPEDSQMSAADGGCPTRAAANRSQAWFKARSGN